VVHWTTRLCPAAALPEAVGGFFNDDRYSWIEGSTKSGKTVVSCMAWLVAPITCSPLNP
jgi:hypothetical protein